MTELTLTPKQLKIVRLIDAGRRRNGYSPTITELAEARKVSRPSVHEMVNTLIEKGALSRARSNVARGLLLTKACKGGL